uniref:Reverse transcriptase domain-containing protein n=1 Tax=Ipomoea batatas TaxID=4120 RepID=Q2HX34_IPOBA|nr:unnamed protein product [Ipomoea batatas]
MRILSWNCRGIANSRVRRFVKDLLSTTKADALCLLEIRSSKAEKMIALASRLGLTNHFIVNPLGFAGGLLLLWKPALNLSVISHNSQAIHTLASHRLGNCFITFAYIRPNTFAKCRFWEYCKQLANSIQSPWMVVGDLNDIATSDEQWGSSSLNYTSLQNFVDAYSDCGLLDPGSSGPNFTWCRFIGNRVVQRRRLDRVLWNVSAQLTFPEAKVSVLPRLCSDHNPILFLDEAGNPPVRSLRPVRFEAAWLTSEDYKHIWKEATEREGSNLEDIIATVTQKSLLWNRNVFGNIFNRKRKIENRILGIQRAWNYNTSVRLQDLEKRLLSELNEVLVQEETLWFQKARTDWIRNGDRNTTFYHRSALIKRNRNRVRFLKLQGAWTDDADLLTEHIINFFSTLFCRVDRDSQPPRQGLPMDFQIPRDQASTLLRRASLEEVKKAVFGMKKYGSPGPDGIPAVFYQQFWGEVGPAMTDMVNHAFENGSTYISQLQAFMTLIPKKDTPETAADFRPITLLNVSFKVISKVLVNRLRPIMSNIIGPHQNSFLPGRSTMDNVILTQEVVHSMNNPRRKKKQMILKVDLQKAYDSVSWDYLEETLEDFGFPRRLIDLILFSLQESSLAILWNGGRLPPFKPGRGLRQGDPLAPYLFNLVMERLAHDIQTRVNARTWKPVHITRGGTGISHLFFADDLMLFGEASEHQAQIMFDCLDSFSNASGLKVNFSKSLLFCSSNVNAGLKRAIGSILQVPVAESLGTYLGIPMLKERVSRNTFNAVIDKMRTKLSSWKASSLNMAGRRVLVQASLATVPTYTMQVMALPVSTCNEIDKTCRNFLWGHDTNTRKLHSVNWAEICKPRNEGGLGLRMARDFNRAFLTKMAWQIFSNIDKLWVKVLREKYVKNADFLHLQSQSNCSWGWRSIMKGKDVLAGAIKWNVGNGRKINFWNDWWVGDGPLASNTDCINQPHMTDIKVEDLITSQRRWDTGALHNILPTNMIDMVRATPIAINSEQEDFLSWPHSTTGMVTVSSAYSLIAGHDGDDRSHDWIWRATCTEKIKLFMWKIVKNGLMVNVERKRRGLADAASCPVCGEEDETLDHLFRRCLLAEACWDSAVPPLTFQTSNHLHMHSWMKAACSSQQKDGYGTNWSLIFPYILWNLWKARNRLVFDNNITAPSDILNRSFMESSEARCLLAKRTGLQTAFQTWVVWSPPAAGFTKLNSDGACKSHSHLASAGGLLRNENGLWVAGYICNIGTANSFLAELWGLREGLLLAKNRGFTKLIAETDSEAVVQVLRKDGPVTPDASILVKDCKLLLDHFQEIKVTHILREGNQCADFLANLGQSSSWGTTILERPPDDLRIFLQRDAIGLASSRRR